MTPGTIDELAKEIGQRLVPDLGADQITPAAEVFADLAKHADEPGPEEPKP